MNVSVQRARGTDAEAVTRTLFATTFEAIGPDYWP